MPNTIVNPKHSSTTSQININPHTEILLPIYLSHLQPKITRHAKRKNKKHTLKRKSVIRTQICQISLIIYNIITMINVLIALTNKVGNMQEQISDASREMKTLKKNQKKIFQVKNIHLWRTIWR